MCAACSWLTCLAAAEKLYQVEHPRLVSRFDEVAAVEDDETGYHISKAWLKGVVSSSILLAHVDIPLLQRLATGEAQDAHGKRSGPTT